MACRRFILAFVCLLWLASGLSLTAQQPTKQPEVSPKILAFLKPIEPAKDDSELVKKLKERHNAGVLLLGERIKEYKKGTRAIGPVYEAASLVVEAKLDLAERPEARIAVLEQSLEGAQLFENYIQKQLGLGFCSKGYMVRARVYYLLLELNLLNVLSYG